MTLGSIESEFLVAQLIERGNVRKAHKRYRCSQLHCYPQIPLLGIECYLCFGLVDSFYPGGLLGQCVGHYSTI
jgi:hypothetical protein